MLCPVKNCPDNRKPEHLMCVRHWRRVPKALRDAVWNAAHNYYGAPSGNIPALTRLREAQAQAIRAVEAKEDA